MPAQLCSGAGNLFSQYKSGKGESFARDDVSYCVNCVDPNYIGKSTDFRIGGGNAPFNFYGAHTIPASSM